MYIFDSVISSFILFLSVHEKKKQLVIVGLKYSVMEKKTCPSMWYIVVLYWHRYNKKLIAFHACSFESYVLICKNCWLNKNI